ncbi:MAG: hypothetical protein ACREQ9_03790, partial [Candidatus Binatia bacterium]
MRRTSRNVAGWAAALSAAYLLSAAPEVRAHGCPSAWDGIFHGVLEGQACSSCHGLSSGNGGMYVTPNTDLAWYSALVNRTSVTPAASAAGKLRVDPMRPWNSFFVDKLTGDLKFGEANPMPSGDAGYVFKCPGGVEKLKAWILAGAPRCGAVDGDPSPNPSFVVCGVDQPTLAPPAAPADGVQLAGRAFTVERPEREGERTTTLAIGAASTCDNSQGPCFITGIDIKASPGTAYVTVSR